MLADDAADSLMKSLLLLCFRLVFYLDLSRTQQQKQNPLEKLWTVLDSIAKGNGTGTDGGNDN